MGNLYCTIKDVSLVIEQKYLQRGRRISFLEALEYIEKHKIASKIIPVPLQLCENATDEDFVNFIDSLPINVTQILGQPQPEVILEGDTIPDGRDVFAIKNIPYVDDSLHSHNYFEINYLYKGHCTQIFENESRVLQEGDMCLIPPFAPHNILVEPPNLAISIIMRKSTFDRAFWRLLTNEDLMSSFFRHALYENPQSNYLFLQTHKVKETKQTIQNIFYETYTNDNYANSCASSYVNVLFAKILRACSETIEFYNDDHLLTHELDFALLLKYIQDNYRTVSLQLLSQKFHYSEAYLSKRIKKNLGRGFSSVLQTLRLTHASEALISTELKVHEIAELVGYDSVDHFSRSFKKSYGLAPLEYRKQNKTINM